MSVTTPKFSPIARPSLSPSSNLYSLSSTLSARALSLNAKCLREPSSLKSIRNPLSTKVRDSPTNRSPAYFEPSPLPANPIAAGATAHFQLNSGSLYCDPGSDTRRDIAWDFVSASRDGGKRTCCSAGTNDAGSIGLNGRLPLNGRLLWKGVNVVSISLNSATRLAGPMICTQPPFEPAVMRFSSSNESSPFSDSHSEPVAGSKARPKLLRRP